MADSILTGQGRIGTAGDWTNGIPTATDKGVIGAQCANVTDSGGDASGLDLEVWQTDPAFKNQFGTSGTPIESAADLVKVLQRAGSFNFDADNGGAALKVDDAIVMPGSKEVLVRLGSKSGAAGAWDGIQCLRGRITLTGGISFGGSAVVKVGMINNRDDVDLLIDSGAGTLPTLRELFGFTTCKQIVTALEVGAGAVHVQDEQAVTSADVWGQLYVNHGAGAPGTVVATTIEARPGSVVNLFGFGDNYNTQFKTVTTLNEYPGSTVIYDKKLHTISNHEYMRY